MRSIPKEHILRYVVVMHILRKFDSESCAQIPWLERPVVFDIRAKPRNIASLTGTKGEYYIQSIYSPE